MTTLGKIVVSMAFPLCIAALICAFYWIDYKKDTALWFYARRVFYISLGLEVFFALLAIWGVR